MKRLPLLTLLVTFLVLTGCTSADRSQWGSLGSNSTVTVYSGGQPVKTYRSNGVVRTEKDSDGWYFTNADTGKLVRVAGTIIIEQQ